MKLTPEFLESIRNGSQRYLSEISSRILFSPPPFEEIDQVIEIWAGRCAELGLGKDHRFVVSGLTNHKLKKISLEDKSVDEMRQANRELLVLLSSPAPDSVLWRTKLYRARKKMASVI